MNRTEAREIKSDLNEAIPSGERLQWWWPEMEEAGHLEKYFASGTGTKCADRLDMKRLRENLKMELKFLAYTIY